MKRITPLLLMAVCAGAFAQTAPAPSSAADLMTAAKAKASAEKKSIFVKFEASWCGWCHKMTSVLTQKDVKPIIDKYFVLVVVVTSESPDKKNLENPGSDVLLKELGGGNQGLPFFGFVDAKGKLIVNSIAPGKDGKPGSNVGCPYESEEIAFFMSLLSKAAPKMTEAERTVIQTNFENLKKNAKPRP